MKNNMVMKTKNIFYRLNFFLLTLTLGLTGIACNPVTDDSYALGGETVALPADWTVTVTDNDNEVTVNYAPLGDFVDGTTVLAVQFNCPEAGISFVVKKGDPVEPNSTKVYRSGSYVLYVAAITRAGAGTPKEVPFTVAKNLILETLSESTLTGTKFFEGKTFRYTDFYVEKNSYITLAGELASDEVVLNLDYFKRISTTQAQFLGESDIYALYYNSDAKIVLLGVTQPDYPDYLISLGKNYGYPAKASEPLYISAYPQYGSADNILQYTLFRKTGDKTFQTTIMMKTSDVEFKAFHAAGGGNLTNNWGNGGEYNFPNCTFSGVTGIFILSGTNWGAGPRVDAAQPYRITVAITNDGDAKTANVTVQAVDFNGEIVEIEEEPEEPVSPPEEDTPTSINFGAFVSTTLGGENVKLLEGKQLEKDFEYTLVGSIENATALFNVDFFERTAFDKVKFLGETGEYNLYYNPVRKYVILEATAPAYPDYLLISGVGFGYPTQVSAAGISSAYPGKGIATAENWNFDNAVEYILFRKTGADLYQATVMAPFSKKYWWDGGPWLSFKVYNDTNFGSEMGASDFTGGITGDASAIISEIQDIPGDNNMDVFVQQSAATLRITVNKANNSMTINHYSIN